jgi:hypothetical protein
MIVHAGWSCVPEKGSTHAHAIYPADTCVADERLCCTIVIESDADAGAWR